MIRQLLTSFVSPTINFYHEWLERNPDVVGKSPALIEEVADDIFLELYLGESYEGRDKYVTAVIAVYRGFRVYRFKYDSGRLMDDGLEGMSRDCMSFIKSNWDLDGWRRDAHDHFVANTSWLEQKLYEI